MHLKIISSPFLDYAISGDKSYLSQNDERDQHARELVEDIQTLADQYVSPIVNSLEQYLGIKSSQETKVFLSNEIHAHLFDPFILKHQEKILSTKGKVSWRRQNLMTMINGITHILSHPHFDGKLTIFSDEEISNLSLVEQNYLLYNSLMYPVFHSLLPSKIIKFHLEGQEKPVWDLINQKGYENILMSVFPMSGSEIKFPDALKDGFNNLFDC